MGTFRESCERLMRSSGPDAHDDALWGVSEAVSLGFPMFNVALRVANKYRAISVPPSATPISPTARSIQSGSRTGSLRLMVTARLLIEWILQDNIDEAQFLTTGNFLLSPRMTSEVLRVAKQMQVPDDDTVVTLNDPKFNFRSGVQPQLVINAIDVGHLHVAEQEQQTSLSLSQPKANQGREGLLGDVKRQWVDFLLAERAMEFTRMMNAKSEKVRCVPVAWGLGSPQTELELPAVFWAHAAGEAGAAANSKRRRQHPAAGSEQSLPPGSGIDFGYHDWQTQWTSSSWWHRGGARYDDDVHWGARR